MTVKARILLVPGLWNAGPGNWLSYWQREYGFDRVVQREWKTPDCDEWVATLDQTIASFAEPVVLVGHSLACCLIAHWAALRRTTVAAALMVAPSDVDAPNYPRVTTGFQPMPLASLHFPSTIVASSDDQFVKFPRATQFAGAWGSRLVDVGALGHINTDSNIGVWPQGFAILHELLRENSLALT